MSVKCISTAAKRYTKAAFDLAVDSGSIQTLYDDAQAFSAMLNASDELQVMLTSPRIGRDEAQVTLTAIAKKAKFSEIFQNTLALMAAKGRKDMVPGFLAALEGLFAAHAGQVTAEITSAQALTAKQSDALMATLQKMAGQTVTIEEHVDDTILGGLVVRVGSTLIDDSVSGKLNRLRRKLVA